MHSVLSNHKRGIAYIIAAYAVLICLDACSKYTVQKMPVMAATWSRYFGHMVCIVAFAYPLLKQELWATRSLKQQLLRGFFLGVMSILFFAAVKTLPLAVATAILFVTPILITVWAQLFLGEAVKASSWVAVALGFAGVLIICRPGGGLDTTGVLYALGAAFMNSWYQTLTRKMSGDRPETQLFYAGLVGTVALTATLPAWWQPVTADALHWLIFGLLGVLGAGGHWLLVKAYQYAPASVLTPWMYLQLFLSILLGWVLFGDAPDGWAIIGMALIAVAPHTTKLWKTP